MSGLGAGIKENGRRKGFEEGSFTILHKLVENGVISIEDASNTIGLTVEEFLEKEMELKEKQSVEQTDDTSASDNSSDYDHTLSSMGLKGKRDKLLESKTNVLGKVYGIKMSKEFLEDLNKLTSLGIILEEEGRREGFKEGTIKALGKLINEGKISVADAAVYAEMTVDELLQQKDRYEKADTYQLD